MSTPHRSSTEPCPRCGAAPNPAARSCRTCHATLPSPTVERHPNLGPDAAPSPHPNHTNRQNNPGTDLAVLDTHPVDPGVSAPPDTAPSPTRPPPDTNGIDVGAGTASPDPVILTSPVMTDADVQPGRGEHHTRVAVFTPQPLTTQPFASGQVQLATPPLAVDQAQLATTRRRRRGLRISLAVTGGTVLALLVGTIAIVRVEQALHPPQAAVETLFAALRNRDGAWLDQHANCPTKQLCQPTALNRGYQPPTDLRIDAVQQSGGRLRRNRADITIRYTINGTQAQDRIQLQRTSRGLLRPWIITQPPGRYLVLTNPHLPHVGLAGTPLPTSQDPGVPNTFSQPGRIPDIAVWALPGTYTITNQPHPLYQTEPATITITGNPSPLIHSVTATIQPDAIQQVTTLVREHLDACAARPDLDPIIGGPANCPIEHTPDSYQPFRRNIQWRITRYPTITLNANDRPGAATIHTTQTGHAAVSYEWTQDVVEPRRWTPVQATTEITINGTATIDKDTNQIIWTR